MDIWFYAVFAWDGKVGKFYVDSEKLSKDLPSCQEVNTNGTTANFVDARIRLGGTADYDDVAVWRKVLDPFMISELYASYKGMYYVTE